MKAATTLPQPHAVYLILVCALAAPALVPERSRAGDDSVAAIDRLTAAYPEFIAGTGDNQIIFKDKTNLPFDDGWPEKSHADWLAKPDIEDMFRYPYPAGAPPTAPAINVDPGRARNEALFSKMYGDCTKGETQKLLDTITWLPKSRGQKLKVTRINGVSRRLEAVSAELEALPPRFKRYLEPAGGTYNCRVIAGTSQRSAHGYGIAIDIATGPAHYWRWAKGGPGGPITYRNKIPAEIVAIFEKHGFIWGGRWHHYDTMHFEYRPELFADPAAFKPATETPR